MNIVRFEGEGPVKTRIVSEDSDPHGWGVFDVKVTPQGIELHPVGAKDEWIVFSFSDLLLIKVRELLLDCDDMRERYGSFQAEKIKQLEEKLQELKKNVASELVAKQRRRDMRKRIAPSNDAA